MTGDLILCFMTLKCLLMCVLKEKPGVRVLDALLLACTFDSASGLLWVQIVFYGNGSSLAKRYQSQTCLKEQHWVGPANAVRAKQFHYSGQASSSNMLHLQYLEKSGRTNWIFSYQCYRISVTISRSLHCSKPFCNGTQEATTEYSYYSYKTKTIKKCLLNFTSLLFVNL